MKQAILVTAYKNFHHLVEILNYFGDGFHIYIHIDRKSFVSPEDREKLNGYGCLKLLTQKYNVNWGGFNHLKSILFLAKEAMGNPENQYFHLISGHDYPIKSSSSFKSFFTENQNLEFLNFFEVPFSGWANNGGLDRLNYYHLFDLWNYKEPNQQVWINKFLKIQKKIKFQRSVSKDFPKIYGGSTWWSLSRECLEYVLQYTATNRIVFNRFKYTFCSEEFYFPTVILNSPFRLKVQNNNLRHIDWAFRNGNKPAVLDESDLDILLNSRAFFARKIEYPISAGLIQQLKQKIDNP